MAPCRAGGSRHGLPCELDPRRDPIRRVEAPPPVHVKGPGAHVLDARGGRCRGRTRPGASGRRIAFRHCRATWPPIASRFAADPPAFRVRAWSPLPRGPRLLELYVVAGGALLDMCLELGGGVLAGRGGAESASLIYLEHGGMLLMFFLFGALALASQLHPRSATQLLLLLLIFFFF